MTVLGYDAIHLNVSAIPMNAKVVFGYDTGTADIKWTVSDWDRFPHARRVHIDQGFGAQFLKTANVMDVERGAYSPSQVGEWMHVNETPDPAIYCNQSTLPAVLATGWRGNLWLAKLTTQPPVVPVTVEGCIVVAQQFDFATAFDVSAVFHDLWPFPGEDMSSVQFDAPKNLHPTVARTVEWDPVPSVDGEAPTGYTVQAIQMNGKIFQQFTVISSPASITGIPLGWTLRVRVWANGGDIAPPGAEIEIHT